MSLKGTNLLRSILLSRLTKYLLLLAWALVIFYLSSEGHDASSGRSDGIVVVLQQWGASWPQDVLSFLTRKAAHTVAYFVFGVLMFNVVRSYPGSSRRAVLWSVLFVLLYAASDEFHQLFVPGRSAELRDILIDTTAGTLGVLTHWGMRRRFGKKP